MRNLFGILSALVCCAVPAGAAPLALERVTIIDPATGQRQSDMTVVVDGTKVVRVARHQTLKLPRGTRRVNASGKYLIPGLWDMHVHLFNNSNIAGTNDSSIVFPLLIANGVTGVRDMWTDADDRKLINYWRSEIDAGRGFGPRVVAGGRILDGSPVSWANSVLVSDPAGAAAAVRTEKGDGAEFIKVYDRLSKPLFLAIAEEAKRLAIPFAGHVPLSMTALEASAHGQRSIEHLTDMLETCSGSEASVRALPEGRARSILLASSFDAGKCRSSASRFKQHDTAHTPTLVMHQGRLVRPFARDPDRRIELVGSNERQSWAATDMRMSSRDPAVMQELFSTHLRVVAELASGGAEILAGTDLGNPHVFAGSSLHDELALMVRAGMSPRAALASATTNPVRFLGLDRRYGTIAVGKIADLVLLDADPVEDITNTKRINAVLSNGRYFGSLELAEMMRKAARAAHTLP